MVEKVLDNPAIKLGAVRGRFLTYVTPAGGWRGSWGIGYFYAWIQRGMAWVLPGPVQLSLQLRYSVCTLHPTRVLLT